MIFRKTTGKFFKRELIADEVWNDIAKEDKVDYNSTHFHQVEILYRQLKRNFEEQRDYARSGDFHFGEMEMKRKQLPRWRQYVSLIFLYKLVSGYGQKWYQGLISFLVLVFIFSSLNLFWIKPIKEEGSQTCYKKAQFCRNVDFGDSFLFTLRVMTLNKKFFYEPRKDVWLGGLIISIEYLIGPTVIALMVLAIRRQFRR